VLSTADVEAAARRLAGIAHRTPVLRSHLLDELAGAELHLKAEPFQRTGSFKFRGAYNHVSQLEDAPAVLTTSSGNHAQAVALAARLTGKGCVVLMPDDAPRSKREATLGHGAEVVGFDRYTTDREELTARVAAERGLPVVHAYDDERTMAGQGTVALELLQEAPDLDALLVCTGGGGLLAGCATVAHALGVEVTAVEPEERPALRRALQAGEPVKVPVPRTLADGQQTSTVGARTLEVAQARVAHAVGVTDAELVGAMRLAFTRLKLVLEPSGAAALAVALRGEHTGRRVGVTLSGGNVDPERFAELMLA